MVGLQQANNTGWFTLGGVVIGALLTPITQLILEWIREKRAVYRAKLLVAGEIMQAQLIIGSAYNKSSGLPQKM